MRVPSMRARPSHTGPASFCFRPNRFNSLLLLSPCTKNVKRCFNKSCLPGFRCYRLVTGKYRICRYLSEFRKVIASVTCFAGTLPHGNRFGVFRRNAVPLPLKIRQIHLWHGTCYYQSSVSVKHMIANVKCSCEPGEGSPARNKQGDIQW